MRQLTYELDIGTYIEPNAITVKEWLEIWQRDYLLSVKPSTKFKYERDIDLYLIPYLGATKLSDLDTPLIQSLYSSLLKPKRKNIKPLSIKSVKCIHGVLHKALDKAVKLKYIRSNPASNCELPKLVKKEIVPLEEKDIAAFLKEIEGHKHELLYKTTLFTGMREAEVLGLKWDCVDFEKGTITVKTQLCRERKKGGEYYFSSPKNGKTRVITAAPAVMKYLRMQKARQTLLRIDAGDQWEDNDMVFSNDTGGYLSYRTVYDCFKRIMNNIGLPDTRFHDLRHTYAVISIQSGDDIKTLQENLGHASAAFTLDVYGHVSDRMKRESANRMESFISQFAAS